MARLSSRWTIGGGFQIRRRFGGGDSARQSIYLWMYGWPLVGVWGVNLGGKTSVDGIAY